MLGVAGAERLLERVGHVFAGTLDILWALPAAFRRNRVALASAAVLVLAGLSVAVSTGGLGVPEAAAAVPASGGGPSAEPTTAPGSGEPTPGATPEVTFQPVDGSPSPSAGSDAGSPLPSGVGAASPSAGS
jgi:hypothetical protein